MNTIIDGHSHFMPLAVAEKTAFFKVNWSDIDRQLTLMDSVGIERALLLYPTSDAHLNMGGWKPLCDVYNSQLAAVIKSHPDRFIGAGIIPIDTEENIISELARIKTLGLNVLSLASSYDEKYLDEECFYPIFEFARDNNMLIHIHPQIINPIGEERVKDPLLSPVLEYVFDVTMCLGKMMMGGVFTKFPEVKFIFSHFGGVLPMVAERFDNTYLMLRKRNFVKDLGKTPGEYFKNLYFDTSGTKSAGAIIAALETVAAEHVIWGSDFPANQDIKKSIEVIRNLSISELDKNNILKNPLLFLI
ncbi:MAG: amidohydrolase family protein [Candidatus Omnitrophica bacterium]|nr:amidohydrolase family protein [Candidatus Omnitrophota bacterium]